MNGMLHSWHSSVAQHYEWDEAGHEYSDNEREAFNRYNDVGGILFPWHPWEKPQSLATMYAEAREEEKDPRVQARLQRLQKELNERSAASKKQGEQELAMREGLEEHRKTQRDKMRPRGRRGRLSGTTKTSSTR